MLAFPLVLPTAWTFMQEADPSTAYFCKPGMGRQFYESILRLLLLSYNYVPQLIRWEVGCCCRSDSTGSCHSA